MTSKKKKILFLKTKSFFEKYPIILVGQHNNCSTKEWADLKKKNIDFLVLKNSIPKGDLFAESDKVNALFQGPSLALGCRDVDQLEKVWNFLKSQSNLVFVGGFHRNASKKQCFLDGIHRIDKTTVCGILETQMLNHLDIEKLLKINDSIYNVLLCQLNVQNQLYDTLNNSININSLTQIPQLFLSTLSVINKKEN